MSVKINAKEIKISMKKEKKSEIVYFRITPSMSEELEDLADKIEKKEGKRPSQQEVIANVLEQALPKASV